MLQCTIIILHTIRGRTAGASPLCRNTQASLTTIRPRLFLRRWTSLSWLRMDSWSYGSRRIAKTPFWSRCDRPDLQRRRLLPSIAPRHRAKELVKGRLRWRPFYWLPKIPSFTRLADRKITAPRGWCLSMLRFLTLTIAMPAVAAGLCCGASPARAAAGAEPWCIVDDEGNAHCNYATSQECLAEAAISRGFCNVNSSAAPSAPPAHGKGRTQ